MSPAKPKKGGRPSPKPKSATARPAARGAQPARKAAPARARATSRPAASRPAPRHKSIPSVAKRRPAAARSAAAPVRKAVSSPAKVAPAAPRASGKGRKAASPQQSQAAKKPSPVRAVPPPPAAAVRKAPPVKAAAAPAAAPQKPQPVRTAPAPAPRARRNRTPRSSDSSGPVANWLNPDAPRPRPSSFIPAPPRAEAPSLAAAPPASSDRIIRPDDLIGIDVAIRTSPVRIDVEHSGGRLNVIPIPETVAIHAGDRVEWDFRYLGGSDAIVEEIVIDFDKTSPFGKGSLRSKKPGSARPHRQLSSPSSATAKGRTVYTIRCLNLLRKEVAAGTAAIVVE